MLVSKFCGWSLQSAHPPYRRRAHIILKEHGLKRLAEIRADFDRVKRVLFYITINTFYPKYAIDFSLRPKESYQLVKNWHPMTHLKVKCAIFTKKNTFRPCTLMRRDNFKRAVECVLWRVRLSDCCSLFGQFREVNNTWRKLSISFIIGLNACWSLGKHNMTNYLYWNICKV